MYYTTRTDTKSLAFDKKGVSENVSAVMLYEGASLAIEHSTDCSDLAKTRAAILSVVHTTAVSAVLHGRPDMVVDHDGRHVPADPNLVERQTPILIPGDEVARQTARVVLEDAQHRTAGNSRPSRERHVVQNAGRDLVARLRALQRKMTNLRLGTLVAPEPVFIVNFVTEIAQAYSNAAEGCGVPKSAYPNGAGSPVTMNGGRMRLTSATQEGAETAKLKEARSTRCLALEATNAVLVTMGDAEMTASHRFWKSLGWPPACHRWMKSATTRVTVHNSPSNEHDVGSGDNVAVRWGCPGRLLRRGIGLAHTLELQGFQVANSSFYVAKHANVLLLWTTFPSRDWNQMLGYHCQRLSTIVNNSSDPTVLKHRAKTRAAVLFVVQVTAVSAVLHGRPDMVVDHDGRHVPADPNLVERQTPILIPGDEVARQTTRVVLEDAQHRTAGDSRPLRERHVVQNARRDLVAHLRALQRKMTNLRLGTLVAPECEREERRVQYPRETDFGEKSSQQEQYQHRHGRFGTRGFANCALSRVNSIVAAAF
ncbi:hypothetical protein ON010_g9108 [Phytophthora cinnamomi]|nr:hypothetical protein ON010_g9108 [Phytophthora cinnamomi]